MKANECIFYPSCRFQQAIAKRQLASETPIPMNCWADGVGCNDSRTDMETACRLFRPLEKAVDTTLRSCPICFGTGKLKIADYVSFRVIPNRRIPCPVCEGLGVIPNNVHDTSEEKA